MKTVALILRKSPGRKKEESIEKQKDICMEQVKKDIDDEIKFESFADVGVSGDDEEGRKQLHKFLQRIDEFDYAYCLDVDRFSRSWLGLYWFNKYFKESKCELRFVDGPKLYNDGEINVDGYLHFFILCGFASYELISIRRRTAIGRARAEKQGIKLGQKNFCEKNPRLCEQIKYDRNQGMSYNQLKEKYNLSKTKIWNIINKY